MILSQVSLSARRAWIEMTYVTRLPRVQVVALRKESVDRNHRLTHHQSDYLYVALRKESVDRNLVAAGSLITLGVALRKESVDRNVDAMQVIIVVVGRSPQGERG